MCELRTVPAIWCAGSILGLCEHSILHAESHAGQPRLCQSHRLWRFKTDTKQIVEEWVGRILCGGTTDRARSIHTRNGIGTNFSAVYHWDILTMRQSTSSTSMNFHFRPRLKKDASWKFLAPGCFEISWHKSGTYPRICLISIGICWNDVEGNGWQCVMQGVLRVQLDK